MSLCRLCLVTCVVLVLVNSVFSQDVKKASDSAYPFAVKVQGEGPPMILIPGLSCSGAVWDDAVKQFETKYQCHVLTLAGFGGEPAQSGPFINTARDGIIRYIRDKKLLRPIILGHSIGGFLGYEIGMAAPDSVGPLISVDGVPFLPALMNEQATEEQGKAIAALISSQMGSMSRDEFLRQQKATVSMWISDPARLEAVTKWGADSDQKTVGKAFGELFSRDLREKVSAIKSPVLLVAAPQAAGGVSKDDSRKRYVSQVAKIPTKTVAIAENSKHFVMFDEPDWLWRQIEEFLAANQK